ncbi:MAG: cation diffusion facilitator family transporter, partial [Deltaproteobacteria bacterium]|nr:cation diffusion facilitator family transporter [Deltaproteobacteria bacterium]
QAPHNTSARSSQGLLIVLIITVVTMLVEVAGGIVSNSLALLGDAGHMFTDIFSISLSLFAIWIARRPSTSTKTYGYHRMEIMAALTNGILLIAIAIVIFYEAYRRFVSPPEIKGAVMLAIAVIGLLANISGILLLKGKHGDSINIRSVFLHIVGDTLSSVGVIVGGLLILLKRWYFADPLISALIGSIILIGAIGLVVESGGILMEYVPRGMRLEGVMDTMLAVNGVIGVHDLHVWTITSGMHSMSSHVMIDDCKISESSDILRELERVLNERYGISHTTIQLECENCESSMVCNIMTRKGDHGI